MVIDNIAQYLQTTFIGTLAGDIFLDFVPSSPDTMIALMNTGGFQALSGYGYDTITFQVRTRSLNPETAYNNAAAVYNQLQGYNGTLPGGIEVVNTIALQSAPTSIGRDDKNRQEYVQNYSMRVRNKTIWRT